MSQSDVATAAGISSASIAGYENAENVMSLEVACKLADVFGVELCDIAGRDESKYETNVG